MAIPFPAETTEEAPAVHRAGGHFQGKTGRQGDVHQVGNEAGAFGCHPGSPAPRSPLVLLQEEKSRVNVP